MMEYLQRHFNIFFYSSLLLILLPLSGMIPSPSENGVDNIESELPSNLSSQDSATSNTSNSSTDSFTITKEDLAIIEEIKTKNTFKDIKDIQQQFNDKGSLYLFAFDVGQANFILLKQGENLGIIDAGIETGKKLSNFEKEFLIPIIKGNQVKFVFVTHPHSDHFSLLYGFNNIRDFYLDEFAGCNFYLAGKEGDWQTHGESKAFINSIEASKITYLENSLLTLELNDSSFLLRVFDTISKNNIRGKPLPEGQSVPKNKENQLSLIIQVAFAGRTILFTGDAEGEGLGRLFRHFASLKPLKWFASDKKEKDEIDDQMKALKTVVAKDPKDCNIQELSQSYWNLYDKLAETYKLKTSLDLYDCFSQENGWNSKWSKTPELKKEKLTQHLVDVSRIRHAFRSSDVIVLPHHGTNTEASQNFLGYFAPLAHSAPKIYIVSSSPFGPHGLPKASILEMAPHYPRVFEHPFLYCRDGLSNRFIQFSTTKKPIFLTGAAPAEFQAVRISKDGEVFIFDPTNQKEPWFQFSKAKELESSNKRTRTEAKEEVNEKPKE